jgi:hypothetical protein
MRKLRYLIYLHPLFGSLAQTWLAMNLLYRIHLINNSGPTWYSGSCARAGFVPWWLNSYFDFTNRFGTNAPLPRALVWFKNCCI